MNANTITSTNTQIIDTARKQVADYMFSEGTMTAFGSWLVDGNTGSVALKVLIDADLNVFYQVGPILFNDGTTISRDFTLTTKVQAVEYLTYAEEILSN